LALPASLSLTPEEKGHIESETNSHIILLLISAVIDKIFASVKVDKNITPRRLYEILKFSMRRMSAMIECERFL
jgi:hypothetical protein